MFVFLFIFLFRDFEKVEGERERETRRKRNSLSFFPSLSLSRLFLPKNASTKKNSKQEVRLLSQRELTHETRREEGNFTERVIRVQVSFFLEILSFLFFSGTRSTKNGTRFLLS